MIRHVSGLRRHFKIHAIDEADSDDFHSAGYSSPIPAASLDRATEPSCTGQSFPLGATVQPSGVNFCVFSRQATRIELLLFDCAAAAKPAQVIDLDPRIHRTYHYWHAFVPGIGAGQVYAYRAFGPFDPGQGLRFDPSKVLPDPYGRAVVVPEAYSRWKASQYGQSDASAMKSVVVDPGAYDWEGDAPPRRSYASTVIYFVKGDRGTVRMLAQRVLGSLDIFGHRQREPEQSLNFVTCHDGFMLNDLASYNYKHNEANGEANRDGVDNNLSWNCGVEGPSEDEAIEGLCRRQVKNFIVLLLTSLGAPMLLMGDEMCRTQCGNNNAYCQDNEISWLDWRLLDRHRDLHRFVKMLIGPYRR